MQNNLLQICREHTLPEDDINVVIREPYFPHIPQKWNKVLVLAESQNLSLSNSDYVNELIRMSPEERMARLGRQDDSVGVYPWDDGSIKLAVEASLNVKADETGVSNAVPWSQRGVNGQNINPDSRLKAASAKIWREILEVIQPEVVVCCGKIAEGVIGETGWCGHVLNLRLPSRMAMSRNSGMFSEHDLLSRYPEVASVVERHPEWLGTTYHRNKIFYACHAVSLVSGQALTNKM